MIVKKSKKMTKMERIDENSIFIEITNNKPKYNQYNQINIMDKLHELYVTLIKFLMNIK